MAFQVNEKMLAHDRALITRNLTEADLFKNTHDSHLKFKPGMLHYVAENNKLFLSIDPTPIDGTTRSFIEILNEKTLENKFNDSFVLRTGGLESSITGQLHLTTDLAPFVVSSNILVNNLNADSVDGTHVDDTKIGTEYLWTSKKIDDTLSNMIVLSDTQPSLAWIWLDTSITQED